MKQCRFYLKKPFLFFVVAGTVLFFTYGLYVVCVLVMQPDQKLEVLDFSQQHLTWSWVEFTKVTISFAFAQLVVG